MIIAAAGMAAALPGAFVTITSLPVLGWPMATRVMGGILVGTLALGKAGTKNAALLAAAILALSDDGIRDRLRAFRQAQNTPSPNLTRRRPRPPDSSR